MIRRLSLALAILITAIPAAATTLPAPPPDTAPATLARRDPAIVAAIARISPRRLRGIDTRLVAFGTRSTFSDHAPPGRGVFAARAWIGAQFAAIARTSHGRMSVRYDTYTQHANGKRIPRDVVISSVVATLHGDEPGSRTYVMSSHYDSRNSNNDDGTHDAPGADDNGSGTAAVLEAARVLAPLPMHATIVFATFDSEEQGLYGSAHLANEMRDAHVDMEGDLNNDIVGASAGPDGERNPHVVRLFSEALVHGSDPERVNLLGDENDSPSRELARYVRTTGDAYVSDLRALPIARADRFLRGGDHESFNDAGFAAVRFTEPVETFTHQHQDVRVSGGVQYGDLERYMDFTYLARVARFNAANLAALARGPARPGGASILTAKLTNGTTLAWQPVRGATGYEIVRRSSIASDWTTAQRVGNVTSVTVPYSKDDWLFGIRAVDAAGRRSIVAFPTPRR